MRIRCAPLLLMVTLTVPVWGQAPAEETPTQVLDSDTAPPDTTAPVIEPERFLPTEKISPDSVISFPADI